MRAIPHDIKSYGSLPGALTEMLQEWKGKLVRWLQEYRKGMI
jgi:hypothetical protein